MSLWTRRFPFVLVALGLALSPGTARGRASAAEIDSVAPPDVYVVVARIHGELGLIQAALGVQAETEAEIAVSGVQPREVYFQVRVLAEKANRLRFERTRRIVELPPRPAEALRPYHVRALALAALDAIRSVKPGLGIEAEIPEPERDPAMTPTHVFRSIVQANRVLNRCIERKIVPGDVFKHVTWAVSHASGLLARYPRAERMPAEPPFEPDRKPVDVYRRLLRCFEHISAIADQADVEMLDLDVDKEKERQAIPSDVLDLASLLIAELSYFHTRFEDARPPIDPYWPGEKTPAQVYQRAGILEAQLEQLRQLTAGPQARGPAAETESP